MLSATKEPYSGERNVGTQSVPMLPTGAVLLLLLPAKQTLTLNLLCFKLLYLSFLDALVFL